MKIKGYAAMAAKEKLVPYYFNRRELREDDVEIKILYCGVCHSDLHQANNIDSPMFPMVPGHEIIGEGISVGSKVTGFKVGDTVGVGCMVDSCQSCYPCLNNLEQYCEEGCTFTYNSLDRHDHTQTLGGYSEKIIAPEGFVLKVPKNLDLKGVGPILCAGITSWSPLRYWNVGPESKVAIIGLGGLGHMGLKLAKALGADVTLFTRSQGKEEDARGLGADRVIISTDKDDMASVNSYFDLIIDTVPSHHDLQPYIPTLAINGTLVLVGYLGSLDDMLNSAPLVLGRKAVAGSAIGGIEETQELLDFCGKHNITADVELIKIQEVNNAFDRMVRSDVKYRFVIDMVSLHDD